MVLRSAVMTSRGAGACEDGKDGDDGESERGGGHAGENFGKSFRMSLSTDGTGRRGIEKRVLASFRLSEVEIDSMNRTHAHKRHVLWPGVLKLQPASIVEIR